VTTTATTTTAAAAPVTTTTAPPVTALAAPTTTTPLPLPLPDQALPAGHTDAASIALQYIGVPYQWGGSTPAGFDCSGLVAYVYAQLGITLPHSAAAQYGMGAPVPQAALQPGDLVFFDGLGHVGIYIGGGQFVHAPHTGTFVSIASLGDPWYSRRYVGARRIG
jgi:cell wall-associated NlpC family hydrolase